MAGRQVTVEQSIKFNLNKDNASRASVAVSTSKAEVPANSRKRKTAAEYQREYRARKKAYRLKTNTAPNIPGSGKVSTTVNVEHNNLSHERGVDQILDCSEASTSTTDDVRQSNDDVSEEMTIDDSRVAQQQTLLWNEDKYLQLAPGENHIPVSLLVDDFAEELSFPGIYLGEMRKFRDGITVTPFQMATSEIRRTDRRGVESRNLLCMAAKNMRIRVESENYINECLNTNLAFLKMIPNSVYYWAKRKKGLFAMIRQFLTMNANEIGWTPLLQLLQKMKDNKNLSEDETSQLNWLQKSTLVNEDASCAIYFDKLINILMTIMQSAKLCPFGEYRFKHFFKRIEFQPLGSPHAHILPVPNFDFIIRFQRNEKKNSGVAINHNEANKIHIITPHLDVKALYQSGGEILVSSSSRIGDLCAVECGRMNNSGHKLIMIAIYIAPNVSIQDMKLFIGQALLPLTVAGSRALEEIINEPVHYCDQPVILTGDFNVNFSLPEAQPLLDFLEENFSLRMINSRNHPTTKDGTTIGAVFARNLETMKFKHFVSYFSYHNPIISITGLTDKQTSNNSEHKNTSG